MYREIVYGKKEAVARILIAEHLLMTFMEVAARLRVLSYTVRCSAV